MRSILRLPAVVMLASVVCAAQAGPPACPMRPGEQQASMQMPSGPSAAEIQATAAAGAADPTVLLAAEPLLNFGVARFRIADYADCVGENGCYWADLDAQTKRAAAALNHVLQTRRQGEKLAMVLDIDETSLANYCELKREAFSSVQPRFNDWLISPEASMAIPGTLALFNKAHAAGVDVFFITGRADEMRQATERNLEAAGYKGWRG